MFRTKCTLWAWYDEGETISTTHPFVNLKAIKYALTWGEMTHAESVATVLFKSTWNEGIIKNGAGVGLSYLGVPYTPPVVFGISISRGGGALTFRSSFLLSAHSRRTLRSQSSGMHADIYQQTFPKQNTIPFTKQIGLPLRTCLYPSRWNRSPFLWNWPMVYFWRYITAHVIDHAGSHLVICA